MSAENPKGRGVVAELRRLMGGDDDPLIAAVREILPDLLRVVEAAYKLKAARDERHARVRKLQTLAAEARRTGKPGCIDEQPHVFDIGDVTEEICAALDKLTKARR